jgi:hypothetical protein
MVFFSLNSLFLVPWWTFTLLYFHLLLIHLYTTSSVPFLTHCIPVCCHAYKLRTRQIYSLLTLTLPSLPRSYFANAIYLLHNNYYRFDWSLESAIWRRVLHTRRLCVRKSVVFCFVLLWTKSNVDNRWWESVRMLPFHVYWECMKCFKQKLYFPLQNTKLYPKLWSAWVVRLHRTWC